MDNSELHSRSAFLISLLQIEGVGRAAAYRLFSSFKSYDDINRYPDEQIAARLKRIPKVNAILEQLADKTATQRLFTAARDHVLEVQGKGMHILTPDHPRWPRLFDKLSASARPPFMYMFGNASLLDEFSVAVHIPEPPSPDSALNVVLDRLAEYHIPVIVKEDELVRIPETFSPLILVIQTGFSAVSTEVRKHIKSVVQNGGIVVSPFEMDHQHYRHDIPYLNTAINGLGRVVVYVDVPYEHPSFDEMLRLTEAGIPIFAVNMKQDLPDGVHPINSADDADWILASVRGLDL